MEKNFGYLTRILFRIYIYLKDKFDVKPKPSEEEKYIYGICTKLIKLPSSSLLFAPLSRKRYINNEKESVFCVINMGTITLISNGSYYTIFPENSTTVREISDLFDKETENRRELLETNMKSSVLNNLSRIHERLR
jgi:hypothetical protein